MVLGIYYLTKGRKSTPSHPVKGEGMIFYGPEEVIMALNNGQLSQHAHIKVQLSTRDKNGKQTTQLIETVAGRVVFNQHLPEEIGYINEILTSKKIQAITAQIFKAVGTVRTVQFLDDVKALGFETAYKGGMTMALDDIKIPSTKSKLIEQAKEEVDAVWNNYLMGLITDNERYNQVIDIWTRVNTQITQQLIEQLEQDQQGFNSVYMMMHSGARGSREQVRQLGGMRGLMAKPQKSLQGAVGGTIENPILANFKEGLDVIEYFISTHGARKGLADTALKTADAGYLTRRLVDVAQDVITTEEDCGTLRGRIVSALKEDDEIIEPLADRILGRVALQDIHHPTTDKLLVPAGEEITEALATQIDAAGIEEVAIRSVLTCEAKRGVCTKCYGRNLATSKPVQIGEAVGVIAAQSIGEPGTQLTMRTFHVGGTAANIVADSKIEAKVDGIVAFEELKAVSTKDSQGKKTTVVMSRTGELQIIDPKTQRILTTSQVPYGACLNVKEGASIKKGQELCSWDPYNAVILATVDGTVAFEAIEDSITYKEEYDEQTGYKQKVIIDSKDKTKNPA
ncbi:MAG: DNA-directed RNA polymerase subunit beta', partial [Bacteroidota bacterium]